MLTFHRAGLPRRVLLLDEAAVSGGVIVVPYSIFHLGQLEIEGGPHGKDGKPSFSLVWRSEAKATNLLLYDNETAAIAASRQIAAALKPQRTGRTARVVFTGIGLAILIAISGFVPFANPIQMQLLALYRASTTTTNDATHNSATATDSMPPKPQIERGLLQGSVVERPKPATDKPINQGLSGFVALPE